MPCFVRLTKSVMSGRGFFDQIEAATRGTSCATEEMVVAFYVNMDTVCTIEDGYSGGSKLFDNKDCFYVHESPAQILALIKEAGR